MIRLSFGLWATSLLVSVPHVYAQSGRELDGEWRGIWTPTVWTQFTGGRELGPPREPLFAEADLVFDFFGGPDLFDDYGRVYVNGQTFASVKGRGFDGETLSMLLLLWGGPGEMRNFTTIEDASVSDDGRIVGVMSGLFCRGVCELPPDFILASGQFEVRVVPEPTGSLLMTFAVAVLGHVRTRCRFAKQTRNP